MNDSKIDGENGRGFSDKDLENIVPLYCQKYRADLYGTLVPIATEVVLLTRMGGTEKVARFLSNFLGKKISRKLIETILRKVQSGEIIVTEGQIRRAAGGHPLAQKFIEVAPWIVDPKSEATIVPEEPKAAKKAMRKKAGSEGQTERVGVVLGDSEKAFGSTPLCFENPEQQEALKRLRRIKAERSGQG